MWTKYSWLDMAGMPKAPAVYAVYIDGTLVYIGQTTDLRNRFYEHRFRYGYAKNIILPWCDVPNTSEVTIKACRGRRYGDWAMRELRLMRRLKPRFNVKGMGRKLKVA